MWRALRRWTLRAVFAVSEQFLSAIGRRRSYGVLTLDLGGDLAEDGAERRLFGLLRRAATDYLAVISLLRWAREDPRLSAVLIRLDALDVSWARLQGLRRSLQKLRHAGKRVSVHLERAGVGEYYLAAAADQISLTPNGTLDITGLSSESVFVFDALKKVGVEADVIQMGSFKSAGEMFTRRDMSPPHLEMMESLIDDLYVQLVDGIAAGRGLEPVAARALIDRGPFVAQEALSAKLVDEIAYADEVEKRLVEACDDATVIDRPAYAGRRGREIRRQVLRAGRGSFALLHIGGTIKSGESIPGLNGANAVGSSTVAAALKDLREREDIRAIVVRVDSPGGSGAASDLIWHELIRTRDRKPVVVSMGDVAASGGYYVALAGTSIFAEPGSITGSIGVIAGKANLRGLYDKLGVTKQLVTRGRHASIFSDYVGLEGEARERIQTQAAAFYTDFVGKVAESRQLSPEAAAGCAEGRVWTGRQAWTRGLVDEIGGLEEAIDAAKRLAGVPDDQPVSLERFPKPRRLWKVPLDLGLPAQGHLAEVLNALSPWQFILRDRIWALLPFQMRFF